MSLRRALRSSLAVRVTLILLSVTALGMVVMGLYVTHALETYTVDRLTASLATQARLMHDAVVPALLEGAPPGLARALATTYAGRVGARVTIIAADGTVLGDSERNREELADMENHADRHEVRVAFAGGIGSDLRQSHTLQARMLYVAIPLGDGTRISGVLRLALPITQLARAATSVRRAVAVGALLAFGVALAVGFFISRRVTRPVREMQGIAHRMAEGDFEPRAPITGTEEVAELGRALNLMARRLNEKIRDLEGERAKVAAMLDSMVEGVIALDQQGRIFLMNPGARSIFGLRREPVEGRPLLEVVRHKPLLDLVEGCRARGVGEQFRGEVELGPPVERTLDVHATVVAFAANRSGVLLVLHDITELRRLERVRTEFVANVSHELRTPLTSIRGYLETLLDGALEEPGNARRFLEVVHTHAGRLSRLVDDLLQLSDLETGKVALKPAPVILHAVAEDVLAIFEQQAAQQQLALCNQVPPGLCVQADRDRLIQILVNLVDNAVKYTPAGGQVVMGAAGRGGQAEVSVRDTGSGIPSTDLPRLTERFYRVDKARSRQLGGTGLGLAIVKHLVQAQGGELRIESELGKGTSVRFTLPAASPELAP